MTTHFVSVIKVNGKAYRRAVKLWNESGKLVVVNEIPMEDYLKGVLPKEISSAWPKEALKAQAVAARTYAMRNLGRFADEGFDLCATPRCQQVIGSPRRRCWSAFPS